MKKSVSPLSYSAVPPDNAMRNASTTTELTLSEQQRAFLAAATSDNTRRSYRSAVRHFLTWGGVLPCDEQAIVRYLVAFAGVHNPRTLALRLTALSQWHLHQGFADPTASTTVRKTLAGIARTHGTPKRKAKALPVEDLERMASYLSGLGTLRALRDNALLQVGFFGGFRRSELVGLQVLDVTWEREGIVLSLAHSKTDQEGHGISKAIPFGDGACCPASALRTWLEAADVTEGPLFRSITRWNEVSQDGMHPASVNAILEACAKAAGLEALPQLSSHSLRRGMATSAYRAGASARDIKRQGGWRHDGTVQGYIEEAGQFEENAVNALLRRKGSTSK